MEPLSRLMIHRFAAESGLCYSADEAGDVYIGFTAPEPIHRNDPGLLICIGCRDGVAVDASARFRIGGMSSAEVIERCNRWNRQHPWPTLVPEGTADVGGREIVRARVAYPAATGTTQDTVVHVCLLILGSMHEAWDWFRQESVDKQFARLSRQLVEPGPAEGMFVRLRRRISVRPGVLADRGARFQAWRAILGLGGPW